MTRSLGSALLLASGISSLAGSVVLMYVALPAAEQTFGAVEPTHDFGEVRQGARLSFTFELVNRSREQVTIKHISESCDCAIAQLGATTLAPGDKTTLDVVWSVGCRRHASRMETLVVFAVGAGPTQTAALVLGANVLPDLEYWPDQELTFSDNGGAERAVRFRAGAEPTCRVRRVYTTHRAFRAALAANGGSAKVVFDRDQWDGDSTDAKLVIETSSAADPEIRIPLAVKESD